MAKKTARKDAPKTQPSGYNIRSGMARNQWSDGEPFVGGLATFCTETGAGRVFGVPGYIESDGHRQDMVRIEITGVDPIVCYPNTARALAAALRNVVDGEDG